MDDSGSSRPPKIAAHLRRRHERSPVRSAIPFQSLSCGATKIIALCAVQPPSVPARG